MKTIAMGGKNRVGSGDKIKTQIKEFERSTFDMSSKLKTTVSAGPIVPIWHDIALPGTTHDIKIYLDMITGPTIGPLFGSFKVQADAYAIPLRLYQAQLHNNMNGIGKKMETIKLPQVRVTLKNPQKEDYSNINYDLDNCQVNPSHVLSYANDFRGAGIIGDTNVYVKRDINAVPYIGYYDIVKNYYCNKQEGIGYVIHSEPLTADVEFVEKAIIARTFTPPSGPVTPDTEAFTLTEIPIGDEPSRISEGVLKLLENDTILQFNTNGIEEEYDINRLSIWMARYPIENPLADPVWELKKVEEVFEDIIWSKFIDTLILQARKPKREYNNKVYQFNEFTFNKGQEGEVTPRLKEFPLSDIDDLRIDILSKIKETDPYIIEWGDTESAIPDTSVFKMPLSYTLNVDGTVLNSSALQDQDGLCVGTYQSDIFNNWLDSEQIGIVDTLSAIKVQQNEEGEDVIYVNEISLKTKVWEMFNAIQASGDGLLDYYDAVYDHEVWMGIYSPVYCGGVSKELVFQQIISNSASGDEPLGTLAGRGVLTGEAHGGSLTIKTDEPSMIMIVFKLTPRLDYSQGNAWWNNLKTMADLHNPYMDRIGFQNLITDKMAWWDTIITRPSEDVYNVNFKSAGKQTAWLDYQTNYDRVKGNFAKKNSQMYMVLNRNYEADTLGTTPKIKDLTTYIDPTNSNFIFADVSLSAQNFMLEAKVKATARRKMSSKTQPIV